MGFRFRAVKNTAARPPSGEPRLSEIGRQGPNQDDSTARPATLSNYQ